MPKITILKEELGYARKVWPARKVAGNPSGAVISVVYEVNVQRNVQRKGLRWEWDAIACGRANRVIQCGLATSQRAALAKATAVVKAEIAKPSGATWDAM